MRLFIALPLTDDARAAITDATAGGFGHDDWRRTHPDTWHVTLAFLGEVDEQQRGAVEDVLEDAAAGAGSVELTVASTDTVARRMVWLRLADEPDGATAVLGGRIQRGLAGASLPVEQREVTPHVTVARWRGRGSRAPRGEEPDPPAVTATWRAGEAVLYRSDLGDDRVRHDRLAAASLRP